MCLVVLCHVCCCALTCCFDMCIVLLWHVQYCALMCTLLSFYICLVVLPCAFLCCLVHCCAAKCALLCCNSALLKYVVEYAICLVEPLSHWALSLLLLWHLCCWLVTLLSCVFCIALLTQVLLCCVSHNDDPWCLCCCEPLAVLYNLVRLVGLLLSSLLSSCFGLAIDGIIFLCCVVNCCAALCYVVLQDAHCCAATHASLYLTCILLCCDECCWAAWLATPSAWSSCYVSVIEC